MKRLKAMLVLLLCITSFVSAQVPQKFSYQAVLRNSGAIIQSTDVTIKASLLSGSPDGTSVYSETHDVTTTAQGVVSLSVGDGEVASGDFSQIPWEDDIFLKIEVKIGSADYIEMGTSQILSVPYSLRADKATFADSASFANSALTASSLENGIIEIAPAEGHNAADPIFSVKNADGALVFAVFEDGVRSYVSDLSKSTYGGFVVGGLTEGNPDFFIVSPDSTRVYVDESAKGPRSGFAVGGRAGQKDEVQTYFNVTPALTEIYFDTTLAKGPRSGFAVGGRAGQKSEALTYLAVTPLLTEVYFDNTTEKGARSGFAVGGRAGQKDEVASTYLEITPTLTSVYVDETAEKGARSGFAVGGRAGQKSEPSDILFVSLDSTRVYVDDVSRGPRSGFAVGGRAGLKGTGLHYLQVTPDSTRIVVGNTTTKSDELGGFTVGGVSPDGSFKNFLTVTEQSAVFNTDIHSEGNLLVGGTVTQNTANAQDSVVDVEGNKYGAMKIGDQIWMTQNLRTMTYNDGTEINDTLAIIASAEGAEIFGAYYSWYVVNENVCPTGWHVPDSADWSALFTGLGGTYFQEEGVASYINVVDQLLSPNSDWSITPSNSTGFSVFNSGMAIYANNSWFIEPYEQSYFWSSTNTEQNLGVKGEYPQEIVFSSTAIGILPLDIESATSLGANIRCIKDSE